MKNKICPKCKVVKKQNEFAADRSRFDGLQTYCKTCNSIKHKKHRDANPEKYKTGIVRVKKYNSKQEASRAYSLSSKYGITIQDYEDMLLKQNYKCAICEKEFISRKKTYIDHCHSKGHVRGLLCQNCNIALGHIKDNITTLNSMIKYLQP
jgi:hypothetical protein